MNEERKPLMMGPPPPVKNVYNELFDLILNNPRDTRQIKNKIAQLSILMGITDTHLNKIKSILKKENVRNYREWTKEELIELFKIIEYGGKDQEYTIRLINERFNLGIPSQLKEQKRQNFYIELLRYVGLPTAMGTMALYVLFRTFTYFNFFKHLWNKYVLKPIWKAVRPVNVEGYAPIITPRYQKLGDVQFPVDGPPYSP